MIQQWINVTVRWSFFNILRVVRHDVSTYKLYQSCNFWLESVCSKKQGIIECRNVTTNRWHFVIHYMFECWFCYNVQVQVGISTYEAKPKRDGVALDILIYSRGLNIRLQRPDFHFLVTRNACSVW